MLRARRPLAACAAPLLFAALAAQAQTSPWYVGASQSFTRESNVYLLGRDTPTPAGISRSDTVSTTALLAGLDQPIGRQRVYGTASLQNSRYTDNSRLDNNGYGLSGGIDWETVERISGSVTLGANRSLARFATGSTPSGPELQRNIASSSQFGATARIGVVTRLTAEAGVNWRRLRYSAPEYDFRENEQTGVSAGVRWRPGGATVLGAGLRHTEGKYPRFRALAGGGFEADRYTRSDVELNGLWRPSDVSSVDARINIGNTDFDVARERSFSGLTGSLGWNWQPTAKLRLRSTLWRDRGEDGYFSDRLIVDRAFASGIIDESRTTTSLRLRADYAATAKVSGYASATLSRRSLAVGRTPTGGTREVLSGTDRGMLWSLGASWAPTRNTLLGCDWSRDSRDGVPQVAVALTTGSFGCSGQILLR